MPTAPLDAPTPSVTTSHDPLDGSPVASVADSTSEQVQSVLQQAREAAPVLARTSPQERAGWLHAIADALVENLPDLVDAAERETRLGHGRLYGEVLRTADQLRFYASVAVDGAWLRATYDGATSAAPSLARCSQPLGPVGVFGASNFPFAFGLLGNDTASALAAGCPVVAKAHPAHAWTCELLESVATRALSAAGAPAGAFAAVHGFSAGPAIVAAPEIKAIGFTGSQAGGLALWRIANEREEVIPFYAEMGTINPVVLTRSGAQDLSGVAKGFVASFTQGSGQFCTKPGLLLAPAGHGAAHAVGAALAAANPAPRMLTQQIADSVSAGVDEMVAAGASPVTVLPPVTRGWAAPPAVLTAPASALRDGSRLLEECFGPVALVVEYADDAERDAVLDRLQGCLAAAVFSGGDTCEVPDLLDRLSRLAGRVTLNDWPTGVAWTWGQQHGGPWPSTTRPEATSVGAAALDRFVRPVTFQSVATDLLPAPYDQVFAPSNPWGVPRRVDGRQELA